MYACMILLRKRISEKINQKLIKMVPYRRWENWYKGNREENENCLLVPFDIYSFNPEPYVLYIEKSSEQKYHNREK